MGFSIKRIRLEITLAVSEWVERQIIKEISDLC